MSFYVFLLEYNIRQCSRIIIPGPTYIGLSPGKLCECLCTIMLKSNQLVNTLRPEGFCHYTVVVSC